MRRQREIRQHLRRSLVVAHLTKEPQALLEVAHGGRVVKVDGDSLLLVNSVFSLRLLRAYTAIKDKAVRRKLVILVEMIAASQR